MKKWSYLVLVLFIFSCTPEDPEADPETAGTMSCNLNGTTWIATSFNNTLLRITDETPTGKRLDLRCKYSSIQIILSCAVTSSNTGTSIPEATYTSGSSTFEALVTIMNGWKVLGMSTNTNGDPATITITSINGTTKTCSGTFSFKTSNLSTDEINYEAVDGAFSGLKYTIL